MNPSGRAPGLLSAHRSEALTDGIYAVAMTLLVIELKLPDSGLIHTAEGFAQALADLLPKLLAWFFSFFLLSFFWVGHHRAYQYVHHSDGRLLALNLAQLGAVSLVPFSCALMGEHARYLASQVIYSVNLALLSVLALLISRYIHRHPELGPVPMPRARYEGARLRTGGLIVVSVVSVLIALIVPGAGNVAFMLMAVINPLSRRLERRALAAEARAAELAATGA